MPSPRTLRLLDAGVVVWILACIGLGIATAIELGNLTTLSHSVVRDGRAAQAVGTSMQALRGVPLIGESVAADGLQVQLAGAQAVKSATTATGSIQTLSVLIGIAVALLPSVPALAFYLPLRLRQGRDRQAAR